MAKIAYPRTISFIDAKSKQKYVLATQFYEVGIYGIWNNDSSLQQAYTPQNLVTIKKRLIKAQEKGKITDLEFGRDITLSDESGLWKQIT